MAESDVFTCQRWRVHSYHVDLSLSTLAIGLRKKVMLASMIIVTHDELELAIGKKWADCSTSEKEAIHRRFIVVPTKEGTIYEQACKLRDEAKGDIIRILARAIFTVLLVLNLDLGLDLNYWIVFLPIWAMAFCIVGAAFRTFAETQAEAAKRDPVSFGMSPGIDVEQQATTEGDSSIPYAKMDEVNKDEQPQTLPDEEKEELKAKVMHSAYRAVGTCFSQCFLIFILCLLVGKIEGAGYSSLVIISPFLAFGGIILCCLACTIFCISEVDENAGLSDFHTTVNQAAASAGYGATETTSNGNTIYTPPAPVQQNAPNSGGADDTKESTWDPERGQVWPAEQSVPPTFVDSNAEASLVPNDSYDLD